LTEYKAEQERVDHITNNITRKEQECENKSFIVVIVSASSQSAAVLSAAAESTSATQAIIEAIRISFSNLIFSQQSSATILSFSTSQVLIATVALLSAAALIATVIKHFYSDEIEYFNSQINNTSDIK
jgi:hypothetical protein